MLKTAPSLDAHPRLASLYRSFGPIIYARCRRALKEDQAAVTATHEVFLRVLPSLGACPRAAVAAIASACEVVCGKRGQATLLPVAPRSPEERGFDGQ